MKTILENIIVRKNLQRVYWTTMISPEFARMYFDVEKFANDLFISDYWYKDGFVFSNC